MTIDERALKLVRFFGTRDPFVIATGMGAIIVRHSLKGVRGFYHYFQRNSIIYVDEMLPERTSALVCAHELGHMVLHKSVNTVFMDTRTQFNTNKYEIEANSFAMELLVPDDKILENIYLTTEQLSRLLGYNEKLIELRMKSYRKLS